MRGIFGDGGGGESRHSGNPRVTVRGRYAPLARVANLAQQKPVKPRILAARAEVDVRIR
jgi:hypothetical protein